MDDNLRKLVYQQSDLQAFRHLLNQKGILSLEAVGRDKVKLGITTEEEILRVTGA
jgi:type II secretory ATPase GspE/PulE/Tfp pilus assembly ATPase PilB-like protein